MPEQPKSPATYRIIANDNYHAFDDEEFFGKGVYHDLDEAIEACEKLVDDNLRSLYKKGDTARSFYESYRFGGLGISLKGDTRGRPGFNEDNYARARAHDIVAEANKAK